MASLYLLMVLGALVGLGGCSKPSEAVGRVADAAATYSLVHDGSRHGRVAEVKMYVTKSRHRDFARSLYSDEVAGSESAIYATHDSATISMILRCLRQVNSELASDFEFVDEYTVHVFLRVDEDGEAVWHYIRAKMARGRKLPDQFTVWRVSSRSGLNFAGCTEWLPESLREPRQGQADNP